MNAMPRHTAVVFGRLQARERRLDAARAHTAGLQVLTVEWMACRLAGGFCRPIDESALRAALQAALPLTPLGELDAIKLLPGMVDACVDTLRKVWTARIDLATAGDHPRLRSLAALEASVLEQLPSGMLRPAELVDAAMKRLSHAPRVLGTVEISGMTEMEPCWRPLLASLAAVTPVKWLAGPRSIPEWLPSMPIEVVTAAAEMPAVSTASASTSFHEAIEALRWARQLVASGIAKPSDIAIASSSPSEFDDHFAALRSDANLDLHFAHGIKIISQREGQAAAALADIVQRGLTQRRLRRLMRLTAGPRGPFEDFPAGWQQLLPADAPLSSSRSWDRLLRSLNSAAWPGGIDHTPHLRQHVELLGGGTEQALLAGETFLRGRALVIWRTALAAGPATSLDVTLQSMREDDGLEACESIVWMPASYLAGSPRAHVRLLGLNSSRWPRRISDDRLLSDHIIPKERLDPLPVSEADRRDFETILRTTKSAVVLSYSRRDGEGRLLGRSGLLQGMPEAEYLRRHRQPTHAFSESDRLAARPAEFEGLPQAVSAGRCWRNWLRKELTPNDGLLAPNHAMVNAVLGRVQSASSLSLLLRNPLGFVWKYGLGLRAPQLNMEPLVLDPLVFGNLVHEVLDRGLQATLKQQAEEGTVNVPRAVSEAVDAVSESWEATQAIPPRMLWQRTLREVELLVIYALSTTKTHEPGWHSFSEVPFGGVQAKSPGAIPWDANQEVAIPETGFRINGYIDRLNLGPGLASAAVVDYKTGKAPAKGIVLNKGKELQRCLYAFAVKAQLGQDITVSAALLYLREQRELQLDDEDAVLANLKQYLRAARINLDGGRAVPGTAAGDAYDDLAFALPANAASSYCQRKLPSVMLALGDATAVWEAE